MSGIDSSAQQPPASFEPEAEFRQARLTANPPPRNSTSAEQNLALCRALPSGPNHAVSVPPHATALGMQRHPRELQHTLDLAACAWQRLDFSDGFNSMVMRPDDLN